MIAQSPAVRVARPSSISTPSPAPTRGGLLGALVNLLERSARIESASNNDERVSISIARGL